MYNKTDTSKTNTRARKNILIDGEDGGGSYLWTFLTIYSDFKT